MWAQLKALRHSAWAAVIWEFITIHCLIVYINLNPVRHKKISTEKNKQTPLIV